MQFSSFRFLLHVEPEKEVNIENKKIMLADLKRRKGLGKSELIIDEPISCVTILPSNRPVIIKSKHPFLSDIEVVNGEYPLIDITSRK